MYLKTPRITRTAPYRKECQQSFKAVQTLFTGLISAASIHGKEGFNS